MDRELYGYATVASVFGDVDGDGKQEVALSVAQYGIEVMVPGKDRRDALWQSKFGSGYWRMWLKDLNGNGASECYIGGGGTDLACYDLKTMTCKWSFANAAISPEDIALIDVNGDGKSEFVTGGDGFLYVVSGDGKFLFSKAVGAGVTRMAVARDARREILAVGTQTGKMLLLLGRDLQPLGDVAVCQDAVRYITSDAAMGRKAGDSCGRGLWPRRSPGTAGRAVELED